MRGKGQVHLHLDGLSPFVELPASITKSGQAERVPLVPVLAAELRKAREAASDQETVLYAIPEMATFRRDLERAEIDPADGRGRKVVLHSLRHSLATMLACAGVPMAVAQRIMRHRDIRLTAQTYTDEGLLPMASALDSLPNLLDDDEPQTERARATGTDDAVPDFVPTTPQNAAFQGTTDAKRGHREPLQLHGDATACASMHASDKVPCVGLEPTTR